MARMDIGQLSFEEARGGIEYAAVTVPLDRQLAELNVGEVHGDAEARHAYGRHQP